MKKLNMNRVQTARLGGVLILVLLVLVGYMLVLKPRLEKASNIRADVAQTKSANETARIQMVQLRQSAKELDKQIPVAQFLTGLFPPDANQKVLFAEVQAVAKAAGVSDLKISNVTPGSPTYGVVNSDGSVAASSAGAAPAQAPVTAPSTGTAPSATPGAASSASVAGAPNAIASQNLDITAKIPGSKVLRFLSELQNMDRAYLISSFSYTPEDGTLSIKGMMFMLPRPVNPDDPKVKAPTDIPPVPGASTSVRSDPTATADEKKLANGLAAPTQ